MKDNIDPIIRRTQQYWYIDGLAEITAGLIFVVLSGYFLIQARIKANSPGRVLVNIGLLAAILIVVWLFRLGLHAAKARLTYPRTGYTASPRKWGGSFGQRNGVTAWLLLVSLSLLALTIRSHNISSWSPFLTGVIGGLTLLALSYRFRLARFALLAGALVLIGAAVSLLNPGEALGLTLSSAAGGACFILSGGVTLVRYLRSTQVDAEADRQP